MKEQAVFNFLQAIGAEKITPKDNWIMASCPLASVNHESGKDNHPSFGISISDDSNSIWRCFTCNQEPQSLEFLLHKIWLLSKKYPKEAAIILSQNKPSGESQKKSNIEAYDKWSAHYLNADKPYLPDYIANFFAKLSESNTDTALKLKKYLSVTRAINPSTISLFDIKFLDGADYLIFPLQDGHRRTQSFHARNIHEKKIFVFNRKFFDEKEEGPPFPTPKTLGMWFGLKNLKATDPVLITEGALDAMKVATFGFNNVVASMTAGVTKAQISVLQAPYYVIGFDADAAGKTATKKLISKLRQAHGRVPISVVDWSLISYNGKPCKDACDIKSKKDFERILNHARHF